MKKPKKEFEIDWNDNAVSKSKSIMPFESVPKGEKAIQDPSQLGTRSKLGGKPTWAQRPEVPKCSECKLAMTFIAQIDSMEHDEPHNPNAVSNASGQQQYMFGDVGMIYVFMCFWCLETKSVMQCG